MAKICGLDFETTGLDPQKDEVTEVGLVLWDSDTKQPTRITGHLVKTSSPVSAEITKLTGITNEMLESDGIPQRAALEAILRQAKLTKFICAHNGKEFDKAFLEAWCVREKLEIPALPWIDTRTDLPDEAYLRGKSASLKYMACDFGFVYPTHRAVNDVLAMLEILGRFDINTIIKRAQTPNVQVRAVVSYDDRLLARERGYHWKPEAKLWVKSMKADMVDTEKQLAPFPVVLMA